MSFKNILLALTFCITTFAVFAQEPQSVAAGDSVAVASDTTEVAVPDLLCVTVSGEQVCIPTEDAKAATEIIQGIINDNKGGWPNSLMGWITLVVGILLSGKGTQLLTASKGVYKTLRIFLKEKINVVIFIAAAFSAGLTLLFGKGSFDWESFGAIWGVVAIVAVLIWENLVKPKQEPQPQP